MRLDRALTIFLSSLMIRTSAWRVPILMYHGVSPVIDPKRHPYFCTDTTPKTFASHMRLIKELGYTVARLADLPDLFNGGNPGQQHVVITFDDGYRDFHDNALPILSDFEYPATVFVATGLVGESEMTSFQGRPLMTWKEIRTCRQHGIDIGSHSHTHGSLVDLAPDALECELSDSKRIIEQQLDAPCTLFSYPYKFPEDNGPFVRRYQDTVKQCGYRLGVSTRIGRSSRRDHRFFMKRIPVNEFDDPPLFRAKLMGAYDWLYFSQLMSKISRRLLRNLAHRAFREGRGRLK